MEKKKRIRDILESFFAAVLVFFLVVFHVFYLVDYTLRDALY